MSKTIWVKYALTTHDRWGLNTTEYTSVKGIMDAMIEEAFDQASKTDIGDPEEALREVHKLVCSLADSCLRAFKVSRRPSSTTEETNEV